MKLELTDASNPGKHSLDVIGFGHGELADNITPSIKLSVVGDLQVNEWNGNKKPQLLLRDILSNDWQLFDLRGIRETSRWLHTIPNKDTEFMAFEEQTIKLMQPFLTGITIRLYNQNEITSAKNLVLLDIPKDVAFLKEIVYANQPERIYAHFHVSESKYFDGLPGREQFGWYYSFLKSRSSFDLAANGEKLMKHKGWRNDSVNFMSKVFFELGFVKIENGLVSFIEVTGKRDLTEAPTYKKREQQIKLEERLLYAPYMELKQWFNTIRTGTIDEEEQEQ